jgi:maleylpyruvate isomerase
MTQNPTTPNVDWCLDWMSQTTLIFESAVVRLPDSALDAPTALPGWTRKHVLAHVHFNALALRRLAHWAETGEPTPMYASVEDRDAEIRDGAALPADELRRLFRSSAGDLADALERLADRPRTTEVTTVHGRTIPAAQLPWLRTRELAVHAVDLDAGVDFGQLPAELLIDLAVDVCRTRHARGETADIVRWLTGRTPDPPGLTPWL